MRTAQRFEQRGTETYKIDTPVPVPSSINTAPYTTASVDGGGTYVPLATTAGRRRLISSCEQVPRPRMQCMTTSSSQ